VKEDNRNLLIFAVLAALVMFGWPIIAQKLFPAAKKPPVVASSPTAPVSGQTPAADAASAVRDRAAVLKETPRVIINTPALQGSINLKGARIDDLVLLRHRETVEKNSLPVRLLSPSGTQNAYFGTFGWTVTGATAPDKNSVWTAADQAPLTPAHPVTLAWTSPEGVRYGLKFTIDDNYMFSVEQSIGNASAKPIVARPYGLVSRTGLPKDLDTWTNHIGPVGVFGNGANYDIGYPNLAGKDPSFFAWAFGTSAKAGGNYFDAKGGWLGFGDHYWLAAMIPAQNAQVHSGFQGAAGDVYQADYTTQPVTLAPGKAASQPSMFFAGAKEVRLIDQYEAKYDIANFDKAIDWGWFRIIEKPIFYYLDFLFRMVGNFGVAIILLTLTIRGLLFPIAQRQFASMAKMRAVQPKMKAIQERFKDDKPRQQQEIMALYKAEGANPLAGCLPTFLQIPILFGLYKVLLLAIDMRHQPFVFWIKDLAAPDPLTPLNLFGLLPFHPPAAIAIGIIPILLGISMYFQFKLNPQAMDETQKQVFAIMPWMLMFVMAPFAVGLQIYWITSNVLTILQQRLLYARHPDLTAAAK